MGVPILDVSGAYTRKVGAGDVIEAKAGLAVGSTDAGVAVAVWVSVGVAAGARVGVVVAVGVVVSIG
jgi:hypothetical protein